MDDIKNMCKDNDNKTVSVDDDYSFKENYATNTIRLGNDIKIEFIKINDKDVTKEIKEALYDTENKTEVSGTIISRKIIKKGIFGIKKYEYYIKTVTGTVLFGNYPQSEITEDELTNDIINANYNSDGIAIIEGKKIKRLAAEDSTWARNENWDTCQYKYFKMEPIHWEIKEEKAGYVTLVSKMCLDNQKYSEQVTEITWEDCTLRKWLNTEFYKVAFIDEEKSYIISTENENNIGERTKDNIFLLSKNEIDKFYKNESDRVAYGTDYSKAMGIYSDNNTNSSWWWLRTMGCDLGCAMYTFNDGWVDNCGSDVDYDIIGIRPALKIDLSSML